MRLSARLEALERRRPVDVIARVRAAATAAGLDPDEAVLELGAVLRERGMWDALRQWEDETATLRAGRPPCQA